MSLYCAAGACLIPNRSNRKLIDQVVSVKGMFRQRCPNDTSSNFSLPQLSGRARCGCQNFPHFHNLFAEGAHQFQPNAGIALNEIQQG